jgi:ABC-2 type transport system permease protein
MLAIYKRELQGYFYSPIAYIFIGIFMAIAGIVFSISNVLSGSADFNNMLGNLTFLFMLVVPILTMRLLSEERKNKTDQLLLTSPASITAIVLGKYFAALSVFIITLVITIMYPVILFIYGNPSVTEIIGGYLGFLFLGSALIAIGVFISALSENQIISAFDLSGQQHPG